MRTIFRYCADRLVYPSEMEKVKDEEMRLMNMRGSAGWQLVAVVYHNGEKWFYFKAEEQEYE